MHNKSFKDVVNFIREMIDSFLKWAEQVDLQSFDWWDIWGTHFGIWAKSTYLKNKFLGTPGVVLLMFPDLLIPSFRRFFIRERQFPICHAHFGLAYLNLFEVTKQQKYLEKAKSLVTLLLEMASPRAHGLGWGMKHDWMTIQGLVPSDTPCNTQTAYAYEFIEKLFDMTNSQDYLIYLESIARHVSTDFSEWRIGDMLVCSYSIVDKRRVVNANSYRALMLVDAGIRFHNEIYLEKGIATLRYVLSMQKEDGSWPYSEDQSFVDNYHTCFVIKNLYKLNKLVADNSLGIDEAIKKGLSYYFSKFYDKKGFPIPFAIKPRMILHQYDSYDLAESISLLAELNIELERLVQLIHFAKKKFQTPKGWFIFRHYFGLPVKGIPYMRYANSAMFLALTKALKVIEKF